MPTRSKDAVYAAFHTIRDRDRGRAAGELRGRAGRGHADPAAGVESAILARLNPYAENELVELAFPIYGHFTWRRRWLLGNGQTTAHFGLGTGPMTIWRTYPITKWSTELQTFHRDGSTESRLLFGFMWHAELLVTGHVRDGLDVRAGVTFTPLLHIPMTLQPVVMAVWEL